MVKDSNLNENEINNLIKDSEKESVDSLMKKRLTTEQQETVKSVLRDPEKLQKILSSPFAKRFMESLNKQRDKQ